MRSPRRSTGSAVALAVLVLAVVGSTTAPAGAVTARAAAGLAETGASVMPWVIGGIVVLVVGAGLYVYSRRRTTPAPTLTTTEPGGDEPPAV